MSYRFTILGCGSSPGVPRINGDWGACDPAEPKNRRLRCSLLVERIGESGTTKVVVDTTPDFRTQMLAAGVDRLDAVLYTHTHADHIHGIDDLRGYALTSRRRVPTYADAFTSERLMQGFGYCYEQPEGSFYPPILEMREIKAGKSVSIDGPGGVISAMPVRQIHGNTESLGFRFATTEGDFSNGGLAYSPDISDLSNESVEMLGGLEVWIVDALQYKPHVSHFSLSESLEWIDRLNPNKAVLTHMHTPLDYATVVAETPARVHPAFDGMVIELGAAD